MRSFAAQSASCWTKFSTCSRLASRSVLVPQKSSSAICSFRPTDLSMEECREEVVRSAEQCRRLTGLEVSSFAYPYGDMNEQVRQIVAEAGFVSACSTRSSHLDVDLQDMYAMPRLAVQNRGIAQFAALLGC